MLVSNELLGFKSCLMDSVLGVGLHLHKYWVAVQAVACNVRFEQEVCHHERPKTVHKCTVWTGYAKQSTFGDCQAYPGSCEPTAGPPYAAPIGDFWPT